MSEVKEKVSFKIIGRRPAPNILGADGRMHEAEYVDVEWFHADGPIEDHVLLPASHPPDIKYQKTPAGKRACIKDCIIMTKGLSAAHVEVELSKKLDRIKEAFCSFGHS